MAMCSTRWDRSSCALEADKTKTSLDIDETLQRLRAAGFRSLTGYCERYVAQQVELEVAEQVATIYTVRAGGVNLDLLVGLWRL